MTHFIDIHQFSSQDIEQILSLSSSIKKKPVDVLNDCSIGLIFEKPSNRTRLSFEVGIHQMGGQPIIIKDDDIQMGKREPISHVSRVLSRYLDLILYRTTDHQKLLDFTEHSSIPVINGLSDISHPCQAVADALTIKNHFGGFDNVFLSYIGDGNNVCQSLMEISTLLGFQMAVVSPNEYAPKNPPNHVIITDNINDVISKTNVIYTDVWISMGQESEVNKRQKDLNPYQINAKVLASALPNSIFLHCLPANIGQEVSQEVFESLQSKVFDQAENRLHAQKGIMAWLMQQKGSK